VLEILILSQNFPKIGFLAPNYAFLDEHFPAMRFFDSTKFSETVPQSRTTTSQKEEQKLCVSTRVPSGKLTMKGSLMTLAAALRARQV